jgi:hypothetical protein
MLSLIDRFNSDIKQKQSFLQRQESITYEQPVENLITVPSETSYDQNIVKKRFYIYFYVYLAVVLVVALLTFIDINEENNASYLIDEFQLGIGLIRMLVLDIPILCLFIHELNQVKKTLKRNKQQN